MHDVTGRHASPPPAELARHVEHLLDEQARLAEELLSTEAAYLEAIATEWTAGRLHRADLAEAYVKLHSWNISDFTRRWRRSVGIDVDELTGPDHRATETS